MEATKSRIAAGLEAAFERHGFAEPSVSDLRDAANVSLRTLYKHCPSRDDMIVAALERRHGRYLTYLFEDLPADPDAALAAVFSRLVDWMDSTATRGCLFHSAVASKPDSPALAALLERHKRELGERIAAAARLPGREAELVILHEGVTNGHALLGRAAADKAIAMARALRSR
jgi:AcrR family transcriptional regulator